MKVFYFRKRLSFCVKKVNIPNYNAALGNLPHHQIIARC